MGASRSMEFQGFDLFCVVISSQHFSRSCFSMTLTMAQLGGRRQQSFSYVGREGSQENRYAFVTNMYGDMGRVSRYHLSLATPATHCYTMLRERQTADGQTDE